MGTKHKPKQESASSVDAHCKEDELEYVSDLLVELKAIAHQNNLPTLEGILEVACVEARLRARDYR